VNAKTELGLTFNSRYIWRGFDLNPDNKPVLQPSVTFPVSDTGFNLNLWASISFADKKVNETDLTLSYDFSKLKKISLSIGFIHYGWYFANNFRFKQNTTQEFYLTLGLPDTFLNPEFYFYYDINNGNGFYGTLGVSYCLKLSEQQTLELACLLGYNGSQWVNNSGFSNLALSVTWPLQIGKTKFLPFIGGIVILMEEVNPGVSSEIFAGLTLMFN
jgi:hypothetical protein